MDEFAAWARKISGSTARLLSKPSVKGPLCWKWSVAGTRMPQLLAEELRLAGTAGLGLERKQILLERLCAINLDEHEARLNIGRATAMRDAWATGRHLRAMKT